MSDTPITPGSMSRTTDERRHPGFVDAMRSTAAWAVAPLRPRLVALDDDTSVNPDHVVRVVRCDRGRTLVVFANGNTQYVYRPYEDVVEALS